MSKIQSSQPVAGSTDWLRISHLVCSDTGANFSCVPGQVCKKKMQKAIRNILESEQGRKCQ